MSASSLSMAKDSVEHLHAFLPPPPSTPDDGPSVLSVPPLDAPPRSLQVSYVAVGRKWSFSPRTWAVFLALFAAGTLVTFLLER
jgi:hypothetical protein